MEKQRRFTEQKPCRRFLTFIPLLLLLFFPAKVYSQTEKSEIVFKPAENQQFYTNKEILFSAYIPEIMSGQVDFSFPKDSDGIHFRTMQSSQFYDQNSVGTKIDLWFTFSREGTYTILPIEAKIKNQDVKFSFNPVEITKNPMETKPVLIIEFSNGKKIFSDKNYSTPVLTAKKGQPIQLKVSIQYAKQIQKFNWESPENAILSHKKEYDTVNLLAENKSSTPVPIGDFELTILKAGTAAFPSFSATATAYDNSKYSIEMPDLTIKISEALVNTNQNQKDYFLQSFEIEETPQNLIEEKIQITEEDCRKLAELRIKERKIPFSSARKERILLEQKLKLPASQNEFPSYLIPFLIIIFILLSVFLIIFIVKKKAAFAITCGILAICAAGGFIYSSASAGQKHGISKDCMLTAIPEQEAEAKATLQAGTCVQILEKIGDWYYVKYGNSSGWCNKQDIFLIN